MFKKNEVKVGEFYQIVNNKLKKNGIIKGEPVYVAGSSYNQNDARDPHNYRKLFIIAKLDNDHVDINAGFLVDPSCLGILPSYETERLKTIYKEDFEEKIPDDKTSN